MEYIYILYCVFLIDFYFCINKCVVKFIFYDNFFICWFYEWWFFRCFEFILLWCYGVYLVLGCIDCKLIRISVEMLWYMYLCLLFSNVDFYNDIIDYLILVLCFVIEIDKFCFIKLVYICI